MRGGHTTFVLVPRSAGDAASENKEDAHVLNTSTTKLQHYKKEEGSGPRFYRWWCSIGCGSSNRAARRSIGLPGRLSLNTTISWSSIGSCITRQSRRADRLDLCKAAQPVGRRIAQTERLLRDQSARLNKGVPLDCGEFTALTNNDGTR